jgi:hypothetical protein
MLPTVSFNPSASARPLLTVRRNSQLQARTPVTPLPALWFAIRPWYSAANPLQFFNLDATGKASCNGITGTFSVVATAPVDPRFLFPQMDSTTPQVSGMAHLTCQ